MDIKDRERARKKLGPVRVVRYVDQQRDMGVVLGERDIRREIMRHRGRLKNSLLADEADNPGFLLLLEQAEREARGGRHLLAARYLDRWGSVLGLLHHDLVVRAVHIHPEDWNVRVLRGRSRAMTGRHQQALEDARTVLQEDPSSPGALIVEAAALYSLGDFEHSLVSYHRAARCHGLLMAEREEVEEGVRRAEEAIGNAVGAGAELFFRNIGEVLERVPGSFLGITWVELQSLEELEVESSSSSRREDRRLLARVADDKLYLEQLMARVEVLEGGEGAAVEVREALSYLKDRRIFWSQQRPGYSKASKAAT